MSGARPSGTLTGTLTGDRSGLMGPGTCRVRLRGTGPEGEVSEPIVNGSTATLRGGMLPARVLGEPGKVGQAGNEGCFCRGGTRWDGSDIVVLEDVQISAPYSPENCTGSSTAVGHIQKLVRCSTMDHYVHDVMGHQIQENVCFDVESCKET